MYILIDTQANYVFPYLWQLITLTENWRSHINLKCILYLDFPSLSHTQLLPPALVHYTHSRVPCLPTTNPPLEMSAHPFPLLFHPLLPSLHAGGRYDSRLLCICVWYFTLCTNPAPTKPVNLTLNQDNTAEVALNNILPCFTWFKSI